MSPPAPQYPSGVREGQKVFSSKPELSSYSFCLNPPLLRSSSMAPPSPTLWGYQDLLQGGQWPQHQNPQLAKDTKLRATGQALQGQRREEEIPGTGQTRNNSASSQWPCGLPGELGAGRRRTNLAAFLLPVTSGPIKLAAQTLFHLAEPGIMGH